MKEHLVISVLLLTTACPYSCGEGRQSNGDLITVDVTASYPKKELILQDMFDVEYIPLETSDEFLTAAYVQAIGKDAIVVRNFFPDGNIFFFDIKTGKGLRKINRKGEGGEEYVTSQMVSLDKNNNEVFVNDNISKKVVVYDLSGNFKRSFRFKERATYSRIFHFDQDNLISLDRAKNFTKESIDQFAIISKQDGSVIKEIHIPYEEKKGTSLRIPSDILPSLNQELIPYLDSWILVEPSSDTIYSYSINHKMTPIIVRTPSIQSMDPEVFLFPGVITDRYCFMQTVKKEYDFTTSTWPKTDLMYDRQENKIFEYVVYNDDFTTEKTVNLGFELTILTLINSDEIVFAQRIEAPDLVTAYEKGELKGRLKEIAATLDEEDNAVIMLVKHKK